MYGKAGAPVAPSGQQPDAADTPFDISKFAPPDGVEIAAPELMQNFGEIAKELKVGQKGAERLLALHTQAQEQAIVKQAETWATEAKAYFGESLGETAQLIRSKMGDDADAQQFMQLMENTGLGSNRHVITILRRLAKGG